MTSAPGAPDRGFSPRAYDFARFLHRRHTLLLGDWERAAPARAAAETTFREQVLGSLLNHVVLIAERGLPAGEADMGPDEAWVVVRALGDQVRGLGTARRLILRRVRADRSGLSFDELELLCAAVDATLVEIAQGGRGSAAAPHAAQAPSPAAPRHAATPLRVASMRAATEAQS